MERFALGFGVEELEDPRFELEDWLRFEDEEELLLEVLGVGFREELEFEDWLRWEEELEDEPDGGGGGRWFEDEDDSLLEDDLEALLPCEISFLRSQ